MIEDKTGGHAFPQHTLEPNPQGGEPRIIWQEGMTLRDYFAAKAMQADMTMGIHEDDFAENAARAYMMADAMLKARTE